MLKLTEDNQITLECDAPDKPGEVKVMVKRRPVAGRIEPRQQPTRHFCHRG